MSLRTQNYKVVISSEPWSDEKYTLDGNALENLKEQMNRNDEFITFTDSDDEREVVIRRSLIQKLTIEKGES
jgi:hypothetical protein